PVIRPQGARLRVKCSFEKGENVGCFQPTTVGNASPRGAWRLNLITPCSHPAPMRNNPRYKVLRLAHDAEPEIVAHAVGQTASTNGAPDGTDRTMPAPASNHAALSHALIGILRIVSIVAHI